MNRNGYSSYAARLSVNVVAAMNAQKLPTLPFQFLGELLAGHGSPQTAISITRSLSADFGGWTVTDKQPSIAS